MRSSHLTLCALLLCASCATAKPTLGFREYLRPEAQVTHVVVMTPYAISSFGMNPEARSDLAGEVAQAVTGWLEAKGLGVVSSSAFGQMLTERGLWQEYEDGLAMEHALVELFEPLTSTALPHLESRTLGRLAKAGAFTPQGTYPLFTELVYATQGYCDEDPREYSELAVLKSQGEAPAGQAAACSVLHLQGKLVDPASAQAFWYNGVLLELRHDKSAPVSRVRLVQEAVERLLGGERGLGRLGGG